MIRSMNQNAQPNAKRIGHAVELATKLEFDLTRPNKSIPYSYTNPNMAGFPNIAYREHRNRFLAHNWTIVRYDQRKSKSVSNGKIKESVERFEAEVASPATEATFSDENLPLRNYIVSLYFKCLSLSRRHENYSYCVRSFGT